MESNQKGGERTTMAVRKRPTPIEVREILSEIRDEYYPTLGIGNVEIEISERYRRTAAMVEWFPREDRFRLTLSGRYFDEFGWYHELREVLKHEIIHIRFPDSQHKWKFQKERERIGAPRFCRTRGSRKAKMMLECKSEECGWIYKSLDLDPCPKCGSEGKMIGTVEE